MPARENDLSFAELIVSSGLFDREYYLKSNPDVASSGMDPLHHYELFGRFELRSPSRDFNPTWYSKKYSSELKAAYPNLDPSEHFLRVGRLKGYLANPPVSIDASSEKQSIIQMRSALHARRAEDASYQSKGILIRTYDRDAHRLYYALASIGRFCTGYDSVTVVCQGSSAYAIAPVVEKFDFVCLKICPDYPNDYIGQQITKLRSHLYVEEDLIYHMDSDCMFRNDVDLSYYVFDRLPILQYRTYDDIYRSASFVPWQEPTSRFLRRQVDYEFMCGFPFAYPRELTIDLEKWFMTANGYGYDSLEEHIAFANNFSEYNLMGAFSYFNQNKYNHFRLESVPFDLKMNQHCRADRTKREFEVNEVEQMRSLIE